MRIPLFGTVYRLISRIWMHKLDLSEVSITGYAILLLIFLLQVAIARILGVEDFGIYSVTLALVALVEVPLVVRGSEVSLRLLGKYWQSGEVAAMRNMARRMIRYDLKLYASTFVTLFILVWVYSQFFEIDPWLFFILSITIPAQIGFGVFKSYFTVFGRVLEMVRYELVYTILLICLNLIGVILWGIYGLAVSLALAAMMKNLLAYFWTRGYVPEQVVSTEIESSELSLTREGGLSVIRNLFSSGFNQIDVILLGLFQKPEIVGVYKVGKSLASIPIKISFPIWRYLQPRLMEANQQGDKAREKRLIIAGSLTLLFAMIVLALPIVFYGEEAVILLYGEAYREAYYYFLILIVGVWIFHGITGWFKFWVVITDARWYGLKVYALAFAGVFILGSIFATNSPYAMAYIVALVMCLMSVVAFLKVFRT